MYRYFTILATLLAVATGHRAAAQHVVGSWEVYSNFGIDRADIVDTDKRVYFCGGGSLFHYDKELDETYSYNLSGGLSDVNVVGVYRNYDRDYVVAVYSNSNLDLVYDDGRIVNLSDIKDAQYVADKTVNQVAFDGDEMYVAAGFGLVRYDMRSLAVRESGVFNTAVNGVASVGDHLVVSMASGLYFIDKKQRVNDFTRFTRLSGESHTMVFGLSGDAMVGYNDGISQAFAYRIDFDNATIAAKQHLAYLYGTIRMRRYGPQWVGVGSRFSYSLCRQKEDGSFETRTIDIPRNLYTSEIFVCGTAAANDLWYVSDYGLGHLTYTTEYMEVDNAQSATNYTIDREPTYPYGTTIHGGPIRLAVSDVGVYATYCARSRYPSQDDYNNVMGINLLSNGFITNVTPQEGDYELTNSSSENELRAGQNVIVDPEDPTIIYVPTFFEGILKIKDGKQIAKYDYTNSPITKPWACSVEDVSFDSNLNLWAIYHDFNRKTEFVSILPYAKNKANQSTKDDWITLSFPDFGTSSSRDSQTAHFRHSKNKNLAIITQTWGDKNIVVYDTKGTSAVSDDNYWMFNQFTDQDGKAFGPYSVLSIAEDNNGDIWLGTECGVIVIHDLAKMVSAQDNTIERIKVPRNDGSSLADYLLDNQEVRTITVDASNCKWLGTNASGAYYVSADGREILGNYIRTNSMIPSNEVQSIVCNPNGSEVYFGTANGIAVYRSTVTPAAADFSEVYAYPNPVRPEYTGWITIKGLMDNSLVKIADAAGNVFLQTRSEGGMVMWNGCNSKGERVATGVYYVYASQNQESSNAAVTKILVVK